MTEFYSTNDKTKKVNFETALLKGMASDYGLYMIARDKIPRLSRKQIEAMENKTYADVAFDVLKPFLESEISDNELQDILNDAYDPEIISTDFSINLEGNKNIMWLTHGPTYSFKDYAARFFGRTLNHFLNKRGLERTVIVATSGDTGGAVADALHGLDKINNIVFFPKGAVSEGQRRQMTTLKDNIYAFEVNGDFDLCQALAKNLLGDKKFAEDVFNDKDRLTSANSISVGRLLPQAVYPFYAYANIPTVMPIITSIPSGNFGDMMGTVIAKEMGLPVSVIVCGVNENKEFPDFLRKEKYRVTVSVNSPSSAMIVSHPSNLARLIDFYGGHMFDQRDENGKVTKNGIIDVMPDLGAMRRDIVSFSINNQQHYDAIKEVWNNHGIVLDPHGAVAWQALSRLDRSHDLPSVIYETADPGKFPDVIVKATGIRPILPERMEEQRELSERIFSIESGPDCTSEGLNLSDDQISEAKVKIKELFN